MLNEKMLKTIFTKITMSLDKLNFDELLEFLHFEELDPHSNQPVPLQ
jgi:hypothetical protein